MDYLHVMVRAWQIFYAAGGYFLASVKMTQLIRARTRVVKDLVKGCQTLSENVPLARIRA